MGLGNIFDWIEWLSARAPRKGTRFRAREGGGATQRGMADRDGRCCRMLEKTIEGKLRAPVKALGGLCLKWESPAFTGVPDRLILLPGGHVVMVETKAPGKRERRRQELVQSQLRALGFTVFSSVDSPEKVQRVIEYCQRLVTGGKEV